MLCRPGADKVITAIVALSTRVLETLDREVCVKFYKDIAYLSYVKLLSGAQSNAGLEAGLVERWRDVIAKFKADSSKLTLSLRKINHESGSL
ncbi:hypothetical protein EVAR_19537_1 [Eumeta japonica]|uniref:Uncharacterized protein n=1 Tax=Eumeta variegata TaxID=151549 RepID=A0A4C1UG11_EUMVA|nr:hypothetical protein EVAR_19537_1 [Eumeta japonica]